MFDFVSKNKRLIQVILGLLILPFAFFGLEAYTRGGGNSADAASVDGTPVTMREYGEELRRQQDRIRQVVGQGMDMSAFDTPEMRLAMLESLISQRLLLNEVSAARLVLSKEDVVQQILAAPEFQEGGKFSSERYANYLRAAGLSDEGNVAKLRVEIPASRLANVIVGTAMQPRAVADRLAALETEKREVSEALIPADKFISGIKPDEAAMKAYYEANPAEYRIPERIRAEYVVLSAEELGKGDPVSDAELKAAYDARAGQLGVAEQRQASHILVKTQAEADKLLAELRKAPQKFGELAKKDSLDTGSAATGGDLGMNAKGGLASKELEDEIFKLKQGELGIAKTEFGFHVVRLVAVQAGKAGSLEDVRKELTAEIAKQKGAKKFAEAAQDFNNLVYEQSDSLKPAADRYKLKIFSTDWFSRQPSGDIGMQPHPKLLAALFSQDAIKQRRNTDAVEVAPGVLVAARVADHKAEAQKPFDEVKADVAQKLARRDALALAKKEGEAKLAELGKGGDAGLSWGASKTVSRQEGRGVPGTAMRRIMGADAAKLPAYAGAERGDGYVLYRVSKVIPGEAKTGPQATESQLRADRQAGSEQLDGYIASLRARAKVQVNAANLESK
jgi:peptidyl-prolyl cis-trans isomerase D